jgi:hypothetical protein
MDNLRHVLFSEEEQEYDTRDERWSGGVWGAVIETDNENSNGVDAESWLLRSIVRIFKFEYLMDLYALLEF